MLLELCNMHLGNNDLLVVRDLTMILLSFAGLLRFDEVSSLLCSDVKIEALLADSCKDTI
jgi:site-specific recombinase XerC